MVPVFIVGAQDVLAAARWLPVSATLSINKQLVQVSFIREPLLLQARIVDTLTIVVLLIKSGYHCCGTVFIHFLLFIDLEVGGLRLRGGCARAAQAAKGDHVHYVALNLPDRWLRQQTAVDDTLERLSVASVLLRLQIGEVAVEKLAICVRLLVKFLIAHC